MKNCNCEPFEVWGFSSNAPNMEPDVDALVDLSLHEYLNDAFVGSERYANGVVYKVVAAKVPSSWPYAGCNLWPPMSSADPEASEPWSAELGVLAEIHLTIDGEGKVTEHKINNVHCVYWSRVIRVDGEQRYVTYGLTANPFVELPEHFEDFLYFEQEPVSNRHLDHTQIRIADQDTKVYAVEYFGKPDSPFDMSVMEWAYRTMKPPNVGILFSIAGSSGDVSNEPALHQIAANCKYVGQDYYFISTYFPGAGTWQVARVKYVGPTSPDFYPEVYCSNDTVGSLDGSDNFDTLTGPYAIVLPSCRANLLSANETDEPWVVALGPASDPKIVTGKALNNDMNGDYWDGSLQEAEVENVIVPPPGGSPYDDVVWSNIEIRSYVHIDGKDYLLFTTLSDDVTEGSETESPLADFEEGDLDHNLPLRYPFGTGGSVDGNLWISDGSLAHSGTYSAEAQISAIFESVSDLRLLMEVVNNGSTLTGYYRFDNRGSGTRIPGFAFNELTNFPIVENTLSIWVDGALVPINIDGTDYPTSIIDNENVPSGNPHNDETFYTAWKQFTVNVDAGPHMIRWTVRRAIIDDFGHLSARIDDVQLPEILTTDGIDGRRRWIYDGEELRELVLWDWAHRDNEQSIGLDARASTFPDCIEIDRTPGNEGKVLIANPHYLFRLRIDAPFRGKRDETFGTGGRLRWTASPVLAPPRKVQNGNCEWVDNTASNTDNIADPPWGATQILSTTGGIQLRGINGTLRDATVDPVNRALRPDEQFTDDLNVQSGSNLWSRRVQGWTVKQNGKVRIPHVEVLWRPTLDQPAYPVAPDTDTYPSTDGYQVPPFPGSMQADSSVLLDNEGESPRQDATKECCRVRDPRAFLPKDVGDPDTRKPVWNGVNRVVSRIYGDSYSRRPQFVWVRFDSFQVPDPETGDDPGYLVYPYPSAQWVMYVAHHCPSASHNNYVICQANIHHCPNCQSTNPDDPDYDPDCDPNDWHYTFDAGPGYGSTTGFTDFDAVDCDCDCCDDNNFEPEEPATPPPLGTPRVVQPIANPKISMPRRCCDG